MMTAYIFSLCKLFRYMNTEKNQALRPEYKKMAWQAFYFILSLLVCMSTSLLFLLDIFSDYQDLVLTVISSQILVDYMPISYVIYCHKRSFERVSLSYEADLESQYEDQKVDLRT